MVFWGVEIKPGKKFTLSPDKSRGRLRISQATLGMGSSNSRSYVQCNVGKKTPVMLCVLLPDTSEFHHLEAEFDEAEEVTLSVIGPRSVYLTGYFVGNVRPSLLGDDESQSFGEDIGESDTEGFSVEDDYEKDSFIDDSDPEVFSSSPSSSDEIKTKKSGNKKSSHKLLKKTLIWSDSEDDGGICQQNTTSDPICEQIVESEKEDQMPISALCGSAKKGDENLKRKRCVSENTTDDHESEVKKVKKKKRKNNKENEALSTTTRTISGGLIVEELGAGVKDGKVASLGKKVTVHYTGRLKEGSQIFYSTAGKDPLKFRLGKGRVMDGLDRGIEGMQVGGKRRLQIPPGLGYGSEGMSLVPPNSWLIVDVELVRVH
ncbi:peptidyl-prolyl cis-trans isomerase FKBP43-like [Spinacia oleracea]|uniref:peptidylprolyl isomerase n=1 Tax=Spinacia oleracea TaxID=3562 RepID=A0A9R0HY02_SPIOL|nr:peptidyl-prolyl cis-trans isomerase FKBP43-like [Spinacia oleracea]